MGSEPLVIERNDNIFGSMLIRYRMLAEPLRDFVIWQVKAPLMKALEWESERLVREKGEVVKSNPVYSHWLSLISLKEWFMSMEDNPQREPMFEAAWNLLIAEASEVKWKSCGHRRAIVLADWLLNSKVGAPTKQNTIHPHSRILIDERDYDISQCTPDEYTEVKSGWNILIYEVEHDPYYGFRFNRVLAKAVAMINSGEWILDNDYHFGRVLQRLVDKVNSGEWQFEPYKEADSFCWREELKC